MADNWHVTSQRETEQLNPAGTGFEQVWVVTFTVDTGPSAGTSASVVVPAAQYNGPYVSDQIDAKVAAMDAIAGL